MVEIKIPNLNKKSDNYFFKKKLTLRRKSKKKLISEVVIMFFLSFIIIYLNYLIPNKKLLFNKFPSNLIMVYANLEELAIYLFQIILTIVIVISALLSVVLFIGALSRILKLLRRSKRKTYQ